jgi:hypothetical protein
MMKQGKSPVLMRARIWAWAPDELKLRAWPKLKDSLAEQATAAGLDPARAFPMPKGYVEEKQGGGTETPAPASPQAKATRDAA